MYVKLLTRAFHTCIERFYSVVGVKYYEIMKVRFLGAGLKWKLPIFRMNPTIPVQSVMDGQIVRNILHFCSFLDAPYNHYGIQYISLKNQIIFLKARINTRKNNSTADRIYLFLHPYVFFNIIRNNIISIQHATNAYSHLQHDDGKAID